MAEYQQKRAGGSCWERGRLVRNLLAVSRVLPAGETPALPAILHLDAGFPDDTRFHGVLAPNAKLRAKVVPKGEQTTAHTNEYAAHSAPLRMSWARRLKRVFDIDIERCACGGKLKFFAFIEQLEVIEKILTHLGLSPQPLPIAPARQACFVCAVSMRERGN